MFLPKSTNLTIQWFFIGFWVKVAMHTPDLGVFAACRDWRNAGGDNAREPPCLALAVIAGKTP
jgi:hypothetical protein